jgi:hypothetical protein
MKDKMKDWNTRSFQINNKIAKIKYNKSDGYYIIDCQNDNILFRKYVDVAEDVRKEIKEFKK